LVVLFYFILFLSQIGLINLENEDFTKAIVDTTQANLQVPLFVHYINTVKFVITVALRVTDVLVAGCLAQ
jgi:hypothetical protein